MPSGLQFPSSKLLLNDYMTVTMITAVGYDYVLTLSKEVQYIWCSPWTCVTGLFILVRYTGLCTVAFSCLNNLVGEWTFLLFLIAADVIMILRVWAMYARSRIILGILLTSFSIEVIFILLDVILDAPPDNLPVGALQMLTFAFCAGFGSSPIPPKLAPAAQITHGAVACILAIAQFARQSLQIHRTTRRWQVNRYTDLLVKQGILYFLFILVLSLTAALAASGKLPQEGWPPMLLMIFEFVPLYTLTPRFIISIREMYERDAEGRCIEGIDTGFGLTSADRSIEEMELEFADAAWDSDGEDRRTLG